MPRALFLMGTSRYNAVTSHVEDLAAAFGELGWETELLRIIEGTAAEVRARLRDAIVARRADLVHGMVGWGADLVAELSGELERLGTPYVFHMQDPPHEMHDRLFFYPPQVLAVHDPRYHSYLDRFPGSSSRRIDCTCGGAEPAASAEHRDIDVLVSMSVGSITELSKDAAALPPDIRRLVDELVARGLANRETSMHDHALALWRERRLPDPGDPATSEPSRRLFIGAASVAYNRVHAVRRLQLAPALLKLPAVILGNGWEALARGGTRAVFRGAADFRAVQALSTRARIVLNVMPPVVDAPHDRTFYSMLAGAAYATDTNPFFRREFAADESILFFDPDPRTLTDQVMAWLGDADLLERVARAGRQRVRDAHTWRHRAQELIAATVPAYA